MTWNLSDSLFVLGSLRASTVCRHFLSQSYKAQLSCFSFCWPSPLQLLPRSLRSLSQGYQSWMKALIRASATGNTNDNSDIRQLH